MPPPPVGAHRGASPRAGGELYNTGWIAELAAGDFVKLALAQINPTVGDVAGNAARIRAFVERGARAGAELVVFCEQTLLGYPARDLLLRRDVIQRNVDALHALASELRGPAALVGFAEPNGLPGGRPIRNAMALLHQGRVAAVWHKRLLPTYDVFEEAHYFERGEPQAEYVLNGQCLGVVICEDLLAEAPLGRTLYDCDPVADIAARGVDLLINPAASPWHWNKHAWRVQRLAREAVRHRRPVVHVNQVGGNDEILFDGASCVIDPQGRTIAQAASFEEDLVVVELPEGKGSLAPVPADMEALRRALVMGTRDYVAKCGLSAALVGLSGGIDSAVVAAIAVEALGAGQVRGVAMPSRYSSEASLADARGLARNLGIELISIPIEPLHAGFERELAATFAGRAPDVTEENLQARIRGTLLMAISNKLGGLLLTTGNKSEMATGYCTLYGDMAGGLAVLGDVLKTRVVALARHINQTAGREVIPQRSIARPPTAELRPGQTDQDSLPPYDVLDAILERYEERLESAEQIVAAGFDRQVVSEVLRRVHGSEHKRKQAAPILRVSPRAFGVGRRMPIAARFL